MSFTLKEAVTDNEKATCLEIRRVVFIEGQGVPEARERRDEEKPCRHFMVYEDDVPLAAMRVMIEGDAAKLQRMAVMPSHQGKGVGRKMLDFVMLELQKDLQLTRAILGAQEHAIVFYQKAGFTIKGDGFMDAGIMHYLMEKPLR